MINYELLNRTLKLNYFSLVLNINNNNSKLVTYTIDSIISQSYRNWELKIYFDENVSLFILEKLKEYSAYKNITLIKHFGYLKQIQIEEIVSGISGNFISFLEEGIILSPDCLKEINSFIEVYQNSEVIYTDENLYDYEGRDYYPIFKPEFSPDLLLSYNYINQICFYRVDKVIALDQRIEIFKRGYYDLLLRVTEISSNIKNIKKVLVQVPFQEKYHKTDIEVLQDALERRGLNGTVQRISDLDYKINFHLQENPLISIVIPTKDKVSLLKKCINSIINKSTYKNIEIIIVNNNSIEVETFSYFSEIKNQIPFLVILDVKERFNYSKLNNDAVKLVANGDYIIFLNNDTEVISENWIEEMLNYACLSHVGVVGAKLLFDDNTIQHAGVEIGKNGAWHTYYGIPNLKENEEMLYRPRNCSAVTGACMMIKKSLFDRVGGFDEILDVVYNDVDICLKVMDKGFYNVWTPYAVLYHYEGKSRGKYHPPQNTVYFNEKWEEKLQLGDPFDIFDRKIKYDINVILKKYLNNRNIYIWGAGSSGKEMLKLLKELEYNIDGYIDNNPEKWNTSIENLLIYGPDFLENKSNESFVIIASMFAKEIEKDLIKLNYKANLDYWIEG